MANSVTSSCFGCVFGIIAIIVIIALILGFVLSKIYTIEQAGLADREGLLSQFDDKYEQQDTFRSLGMENWKIWDVLLWIIKSGNHEPKEAKPSKIFD
ncbi:MAG: hypothetical protein MSH40_05035 [Christensenella sp.]|nr:hypothetical protein [Christensenella sp.]